MTEIENSKISFIGRRGQLTDVEIFKKSYQPGHHFIVSSTSSGMTTRHPQSLPTYFPQNNKPAGVALLCSQLRPNYYGFCRDNDELFPSHIESRVLSAIDRLSKKRF